MEAWRIETDFVHNPIAVRAVPSQKVIAKLNPEKESGYMEAIKALVDKHNEEIKNEKRN